MNAEGADFSFIRVYPRSSASLKFALLKTKTAVHQSKRPFPINQTLQVNYNKPAIISWSDSADGRSFSTGTLANPFAGKWLASARFSRSPS